MAFVPCGHPAIENKSRGQETYSCQKKRRNFADTHTNGEIGRSPDKIDNRESQQSLPGRAMRWGFHSGFLTIIYQFAWLIAPPVSHSNTNSYIESQKQQ